MPSDNNEQLDKMLTQRLIERIPSSGLKQLQLLREDLVKESAHNMVLVKDDHNEFPTLLHFAAYHGLMSLTTVLLECPGASIAGDLKNRSDLTPAELAQLNGHHKVAQKLFDKQSDINQPSIYDYVNQQAKTVQSIQERRFQQHYQNQPLQLRGQPLVTSSPGKPNSNMIVNNSFSEYQVPPPPRPVEGSIGGFVNPPFTQKPYLDMSGSSSSNQSSPAPVRKAVRDQRLQKVQESPEYYEIKTPPTNKDPFGTMRAARSRKPIDSALEDDDVFLPPTSKSTKASQTKPKDPFGTLRANKALSGGNKKMDPVDYRGALEEKKNNVENELAITNELLQLLEDFKTKNYSVKDMETMFDQWRRKASIFELPPEKAKVIISLMKLLVSWLIHLFKFIL